MGDTEGDRKFLYFAQGTIEYRIRPSICQHYQKLARCASLLRAHGSELMWLPAVGAVCNRTKEPTLERSETSPAVTLALHQLSGAPALTQAMIVPISSGERGSPRLGIFPLTIISTR